MASSGHLPVKHLAETIRSNNPNCADSPSAGHRKPRRLFHGRDSRSAEIESAGLPRVSLEEKRRIQASDEHFLEELNRQLSDDRFRPFAIYELREPGTRHDFPRRQMALLDEWLRQNPTLRAMDRTGSSTCRSGIRR